MRLIRHIQVKTRVMGSFASLEIAKDINFKTSLQVRFYYIYRTDLWKLGKFSACLGKFSKLYVFKERLSNISKVTPGKRTFIRQSLTQ
jgi:hypothetical protein